MSSTSALHVRSGPAPRPHPGVSLAAYILDALRQHAALDLPAQVDSLTGREMSFAELLQQSVRAAQGWRALGLGSGDTLAVFSFNNHHLYPAFFGAVLEGITVAIVKHSTADELRGFLEKCGPKAILTEPSSLDVTLAVAGPGGLDLLHVVTTDGDLAAGDGARVLTTRDLMAKGADADPAAYRAGGGVADDPREHIAFLSFSSGTSGLPKMVKLSDYSFTMTLLFMTDWLVRPADRVFITSQLAWITGLAFTLTCTVVGATRVYGWYDARAGEVDWFGTLQRHRITTWFLAPPGLTLLAAEARARRARGQGVPMGSVRALLTSGTGLHADAQRHFAEVLETPVVQWYGITEVGIVASDALPARPGSVGRLAPGVQLRLVDVDSGRDVAVPGVLGEVRATAPSLMSGYQGAADDAMAEVLDEHGFYRTGDLGYLDADGFLFLVDRMKDSLKFDGVPIAPAEVEAVLVSHPAVKEAVVVGRPHPRLVDVPTAFVVVQEGAAAVSEAELQDLVKDRLSYEKWLRGGVFFRDAIPKLSNGKIDRRDLKEWLKTLPAPHCEL